MGRPARREGRPPAAGRRGRRAAHAADPKPLAAALVAALEQALSAAEELLGALHARDRRIAAAVRREPTRTLARAREMLDGQALTLLTPNEPRAILRSPEAASAVACDALSPREVEVLRLLAVGRSNQQIAQALFLSPRTVQRHVANVYLKVGTHNRAEATAYAIRHRLA